jgi:hypothetical protein
MPSLLVPVMAVIAMAASCCPSHGQFCLILLLAGAAVVSYGSGAVRSIWPRELLLLRFLPPATVDDAASAAPPPEAGAAAGKVPVAVGITAISRRHHGHASVALAWR